MAYGMIGDVDLFNKYIAEKKISANDMNALTNAFSSFQKEKTKYKDNSEFRDFVGKTYGKKVNLKDPGTAQNVYKQYKYNQSRVQNGFMPIDFWDSSYDPSTADDDTNEYLSSYVAKNKHAPKENDRAAFNTGLAQYKKEKKAKAYTDQGYQYSSTYEDVKRRQQGLPPLSYENTKKVQEALQSFYKNVEKAMDTIPTDTVNANQIKRTIIQDIYNKYPILKQADSYAAIGMGMNAASMPFNADILKQWGYDAKTGFAGIVDKTGMLIQPESRPMESNQATARVSVKPNLAMLNYVPQNSAPKPNFTMLSQPDRIYTEELKLKKLEKEAREAARPYPSLTDVPPDVRAKLDEYEKQKALIDQLKSNKFYDDRAASKADLEKMALNAPDLSVGVENAKSITGADAWKKVTDERTNLMYFINGIGTAEIELSESDYHKYKKMTEEEKNTLRYFYGIGDYKRFDEYNKAISCQLDQRHSEANLSQNLEMFNKLGVAGKGLSAIASVGASFATPLSYIENAYQAAKNEITGNYKPTNVYSPAQNIVTQKQAYQDYTLKGASPVVRFLGQVGFGIADMATKIPFGPVGATAYMAAGAAGEATNDALKHGASPTQAVGYGTIAGALEYVTEKLPIDKLFRLSKTMTGAPLKKAILKVLDQAGIEATQEAITEYAGTLTDIQIMGDKSAYALRVKELISGGMSEQKAKEQANFEFFVKNPTMAAFGGALSGGFMSGSMIALSNLPNSQSTSKPNTDAQNLTQKNTQPTMQQSASIPAIAQAKADPVTKLLTNQPLTSAEINSLKTSEGRARFEAATGIKLGNTPSKNRPDLKNYIQNGKKVANDLEILTVTNHPKNIAARQALAAGKNPGRTAKPIQNDLITLTVTNKAISVAAEQTAKALVSKLRTGELTAPMLESAKNPAVKVKVEALIGTRLGNTPAAIKAELAKVSQETLAQTLYRKYAGDSGNSSVYTEHNNAGPEEIAGDYEEASAGGAGEIESGGGERGNIHGAGDSSWYKPDGSINYPPNNGAVPGSEETIKLPLGEKLGRYGKVRSNSNYVTIAGTDSKKLALPPNTDPSEYYEYEILKPILETIKSTIMEWPLGSGTGGGIQFELPMPIEELRHLGFIRKVEHNAK